MQLFEVAFKEGWDCSEGIAGFRFEKPEGYTFSPGQYMSVTLQTRDGAQMKPFSIASAPSDPHLELATRLSGSAFKDALTALKQGDRVEISSANGRLVLPEGERRAAFLVGGVGITPAHSILRDAVQRKTGLEALLFYGNRDEGCVPYKEEFDRMAGDGTVRVFYVYEHPSQGWTGPSGFITADTVRQQADAADGWRWFVSGPPSMVEPMRKVLDELEVPAEKRSIETFAGYER